MSDYISDGIRLLMKDGSIEDHDPVDHDDYVYLGDKVIVSSKWDYNSADVLEVIPYKLYRTEDKCGYERFDINGGKLNG